MLRIVEIVCHYWREHTWPRPSVASRIRIPPLLLLLIDTPRYLYVIHILNQPDVRSIACACMPGVWIRVETVPVVILRHVDLFHWDEFVFAGNAVGNTSLFFSRNWRGVCSVRRPKLVSSLRVSWG